MTRFERCWIYIMVILAAMGNLLTLARVRELESEIMALEQQDEAVEPMTASLRMAQQADAGASRRKAVRLSDEPAAGRQIATFTAYAYCACEKCCGRWAQYGLTASGTVPQQGRTVAVDPDVIPLGSKVWIDGVGPYIAEDTGSGIDGNTIDVFYESHQSALSWGKRTVTVEWAA